MLHFRLVLHLVMWVFFKIGFLHFLKKNLSRKVGTIGKLGGNQKWDVAGKKRLRQQQCVCVWP